MNYDDRFMDNHICHSELVSESYKNKNLDPVQGTPSENRVQDDRFMDNHISHSESSVVLKKVPRFGKRST